MKKAVKMFVVLIVIQFFLCVNAYANHGLVIDNMWEGKKELQFIDGSKIEYKDDHVFFMIDGSIIPTDSLPIDNGSSLVPIRTIANSLSATTAWDAKTKEIAISYNNTIISMQIGSKNATVNGQNKTLSTAPRIINNSTYVPLRFVSEAFEIDVGYYKGGNTFNYRPVVWIETVKYCIHNSPYDAQVTVEYKIEEILKQIFNSGLTGYSSYLEFSNDFAPKMLPLIYEGEFSRYYVYNLEYYEFLVDKIDCTFYHSRHTYNQFWLDEMNENNFLSHFFAG